jgi:hypothetical protein
MEKIPGRPLFIKSDLRKGEQGEGGYKGFPTFGVIHPSTSTRPLHLLAQGLKIYNHRSSPDHTRILSTRIQNPALEDCEECYFIGGSWYQICFRENSRLPAFLLTLMVEYFYKYEPEWSKGKSAVAEILYFNNLTTQVNTCRQRSVDSTMKMTPTSLAVSVGAV